LATTLFGPSRRFASKTLSQTILTQAPSSPSYSRDHLFHPRTSYNNSESDSHILHQLYSNKSIPSQWQAPEIAHMTRTFPQSQRLAELALNPLQAIKERPRYKQ